MVLVGSLYIQESIRLRVEFGRIADEIHTGEGRHQHDELTGDEFAGAETGYLGGHFFHNNLGLK